MSRDRPLLGIGLMVLTTLVFAIQDGFSRHLAAEYSTTMVIMLRYWFFAAFVLVFAATRGGGIGRVAHTDQPLLQIGRGLVLAVEILIAVKGFVLIGLVNSHAVFACYPLLVAALSGPLLGERIGWQRWTAIAVGFLGVLIILQPTGEETGWAHMIPFASALLFALYQIMTRRAARHDGPATSLFYTGIAGAVALTIVGLPYLEPMRPADQGWMLALAISGVLGHYLLIKALDVAEAGLLQPFTYFHLVFAALIGVSIFAETITTTIIAGAALIIASGLFALWRQSRARR